MFTIGSSVARKMNEYFKSEYNYKSLFSGNVFEKTSLDNCITAI